MTPADPIRRAAARRGERPGRVHGEAGTGLVGSVAALGAFTAFLLVTVQLAVNLTAGSAVSAAAYGGARVVASRSVDHHDPVAVAAAERVAAARMRQTLGAAGEDATLTWTVGPDAVRLHVHLDPPSVLPTALSGRVGLDAVDRTFVVRIEEGR